MAVLQIISFFANRSYEWSVFGALFIIGYIFLKRGKHLTFILFMGFSFIYLKFARPTFNVLRNLNVDSIFQGTSFDLNEGIFYISQLIHIIYKNSVNIKNWFILGTLYFCVFYLLIYFAKKFYKRINFLNVKFEKILLCSVLFLLLIGLSKDGYSLLNSWNSALKLPEIVNSNIIRTSYNQNESTTKPNNLIIITYIGESTSSMHMGIYNYWRNTTPELNKTENLIVFDKVFSPHTHTTPSLLESLCFINNTQKVKTAYKNKILPIVDFLNKYKIKTTLITNQGIEGNVNLGASIIFKNSDAIITGNNNFKTFGNLSMYLDRPYDHNLFTNSIENIYSKKRIRFPQAIFLHSYAGHGPYSKHIPENFRVPIDNKLEKFSVEEIFGKNYSSKHRKLLENYDSSVRYIDYTISELIKYLNGNPNPTVFIFFSDHGESPFSGRAHDSSRFVHEMARIPLIIHFNDSARLEYKDEYDKILNLQNLKYTTSRIIPKIISDLFGIQAPNLGGKEDPEALLPIVVNDKMDGFSKEKSAVFINDDFKETNFIINNDSSTNNFIIENNFKHLTTCYHRSNTLGRLIRGSISSECVEVDLIVQDDGSISIDHPPQKRSNINFSDLNNIISNYKPSIWLDSKNISTPSYCQILSKKLRVFRKSFKKILVEFPDNTDFNNSKIKECVSSIRNNDIKVSYYMPTKILINCSENISAENNDCTHLEKIKFNLRKNGIKDISFDFRGSEAIKRLNFENYFNLHAWHIDPLDKDFVLNTKNLNFIIPFNHDPNFR